MVRLTVVNDNPDLLALIGDILEGDRHVTTLIGSVHDDLLEPICRSKPDLLIVDLRLGGDSRHGVRLARRLRSTPGCEGLPVVVCTAGMTGLPDVEQESPAGRGVVALEMPFAADELLRVVRTLLGDGESRRCS